MQRDKGLTKYMTIICLYASLSVRGAARVTDTHTPKTQRRVTEYSATRDPGVGRRRGPRYRGDAGRYRCTNHVGHVKSAPAQVRQHAAKTPVETRLAKG